MTMLGETKQNVIDILTKLQAYESGLSSLQTIHKDYQEQTEKQVKEISERKLVLVAELHRLLS